MAISENERGIREILAEDRRRMRERDAPFDPVSGLGSVGRRTRLLMEDYPIREQWIPEAMARVPLVRMAAEAGSVRALLERLGSSPEDAEEDRAKVIRQLTEIRIRHDFPFWAASFAYISNKEAGPDVLFRLTRPQRRLVAELEEMRLKDEPIRLILLKARQWGGSTTIQMYMAWLQLTRREGLNSVIVAHQASGSARINAMFEKMLKAYPTELLHPPGEPYSENEPKWVGVGTTGTIHRVPQRGCEINVGTAERPDSCRSGSYSLAHFSEPAYWPDTEGKKPEDIIQAVGGGILYRPMTMIVYESTANGTGGWFHREYEDAKAGRSQFRPLFITWRDIGLYTLPPEDRRAFARELWLGRLNENEPSDREESGAYLWWLWRQGASLDSINWYVHERRKFTSHERMAEEYPSDDVEAFSNSGARVFDRYRVEELRPTCRAPKRIGDVAGRALTGPDSLRDVKFTDNRQDPMYVWAAPEEDAPGERTLNRYLVVMDVGGRSRKADWSVITVYDRLFMTEPDGKPEIAAQWYGHTDIDLLAWKAAQIARYYNDALLVIESNTLETHDVGVEGDQSEFILDQIADAYGSLYARRQSAEEIRNGVPRRYGFHTNTRTKPMVISWLIKCVRERLYVERDERALHEYLCYERKPNGSWGNIDGEHDDILMTRAIGLWVCFNDMEPPRTVRTGSGSGRAPRPRVVGEATI
ncbi:MAG: terminase [Clostridia bacterium]|nr:terminase [Clostridia bacterium]